MGSVSHSRDGPGISYPAADGTFEGLIETAAPAPGLAHFEPVLRAAKS